MQHVMTPSPWRWFEHATHHDETEAENDYNNDEIFKKVCRSDQKRRGRNIINLKNMNRTSPRLYTEASQVDRPSGKNATPYQTKHTSREERTEEPEADLD